MASRGFRAFSFLLLSGAFGGFFLSSGAAHYFVAGTDRPKEAAAGGDDGGEAPGKTRATQQGGDEQEGKTASAASAAAPTAGGKPAKEKSGSGEEAGDAPPAPARTTLSENDVIAFLSGNTIEQRDPDTGTAHRYVSRRGWQGEVDPAGHIVVHRWMARENEFCMMATEQKVVCSTVAISREKNPAMAIGTRLGTIGIDGGPAWPVLRGNVAHVPEVMPLIDGVRRLSKATGAKTIPAKGDDPARAIVGRPLLREVAEGEGVSGVYYDPDGRWVTTAPLAPGARTGLGGLRVTIGQWSIRAGALCLDEPGLQLTRKCYRPQPSGDTAFRLVPTQAGTPTVLSVLAEGA